MAQSISEEKAFYRKRFRDITAKLSGQQVESQSIAITSKVARLPEYQRAKSISIFLSMPGKEVSTQNIVQQAFRDGKKVFIPYIHSEKGNSKSKVMDMLRLQDEQDLSLLKSDSWGIPSLPSETIDRRENALGGFGIFEQGKTDIETLPSLDLVFVPAVAFDWTHHRLGHGKGFYDRYFTLYQGLCNSTHFMKRMPFLVGLALNEQVLDAGEELPTTSDDWKVDVVINANTTWNSP